MGNDLFVLLRYGRMRAVIAGGQRGRQRLSRRYFNWP